MPIFLWGKYSFQNLLADDLKHRDYEENLHPCGSGLFRCPWTLRPAWGFEINAFGEKLCKSLILRTAKGSQRIYDFLAQRKSRSDVQWGPQIKPQPARVALPDYLVLWDAAAEVGHSHGLVSKGKKQVSTALWLQVKENAPSTEPLEVPARRPRQTRWCLASPRQTGIQVPRHCWCFLDVFP